MICAMLTRRQFSKLIAAGTDRGPSHRTGHDPTASHLQFWG
jgi:hypothetical protein